MFERKDDKRLECHKRGHVHSSFQQRTIKTTTDGFLGRRKDHLVLDRGIIGGPIDKFLISPDAHCSCFSLLI